MVAPRAAMRRLTAAIGEATGITCSVGIGPNKLVAKVASDAEKPRGFVALTREEACARFGGASPTLVPGIGGKTAERLAGLGIGTLAALAAAPPELLIERFGVRLGPWLQSRARFEDDGEVCAERIAVSESRETTFPVDIADPAELERILDDLTDRLCEGLRRADRRGRTIGIKVRLDDFSTHTRARTLPAAVNDPTAVGDVARTLLREFAAPRPVRLLGVRVAGFEGEAEAAADPGQLALPM
jgi:DNA polymerase-4